MSEQAQTKVPARRVRSDSCKVIGDNSEVYYPHVGEFVWMVPAMSVGEFRQITFMGEMDVRLAAVKGEPNEQQLVNQILDESYEELCECLADRILDWDWTNHLGRPLPKPDGTVKPLRRLSASELYWLLTAAQGETEGEEKKGSSDSPTTSSATKRRPSRA